jgi:hypothetical protein
MSATPQSPSTPFLLYQATAYPVLPPVAVTRQALFQFNLSIYRQLAVFEKQFAEHSQPKELSLRKGWLPPLRKPR